MEEKIRRINELYHLSQKRALTEAELSEQKKLRADYIEAIRASVKAQISNIEIVEADGSRHGVESVRDRKEALRKICLDTRKGISGDRKSEAAQSLTAEFIKIAGILRAKKVLLYASLPEEVKTDELFEECRKSGLTVYFPKCKGNDLIFYETEDLNELSEGSFRVREPKENPEKEFRFLQNIEDTVLVLVPGLTFNDEGYRLGYGKGFYDTFLDQAKSSNIKTAGVCFKELKTENISGWKEALPRDKHDKKTDFVLFV